MSISQKRLKELVWYNPSTGIFTWKTTGRGRKSNREASSPQNNGYLRLRIEGKDYLLHRLAFLYMTGAFPSHDVDHINCIKTDNRWNNLRCATRTQNLGNSKKPKHNKSGFKGVGFYRSKWRARIQYKGREIPLGCFETPQEAHIAYVKAAKCLFGKFARTGETP